MEEASLDQVNDSDEDNDSQVAASSSESNSDTDEGRILFASFSVYTYIFKRLLHTPFNFRCFPINYYD